MTTESCCGGGKRRSHHCHINNRVPYGVITEPENLPLRQD